MVVIENISKAYGKYQVIEQASTKFEKGQVTS
ncbi:siderophore ABC transporter ATP-binding protein, partial [Vibrio anguillarum]|nr:siderophore ABC transporter ATP-binding protein [Vibrio anguillarum]